jgi:PKD repeat protein
VANGPYSAKVGEVVSFTSRGSKDPDGSIAEYRWDFGDGTPESTKQNATHAYTAANSYTVTLKVKDNRGATAMATASCTVSSATSGQSPDGGTPSNIFGGVRAFFASIGDWLAISSLEKLVAIISIVGGSIGVYSQINRSSKEKKRQKFVFETFSEKIDEVYTRFKMNARECETELYKVKGEIAEEFKDGKIEPNYYNFLEQRINEYMKEIKEQINKEK